MESVEATALNAQFRFPLIYFPHMPPSAVKVRTLRKRINRDFSKVMVVPRGARRVEVTSNSTQVCIQKTYPMKQGVLGPYSTEGEENGTDLPECISSKDGGLCCGYIFPSTTHDTNEWQKGQSSLLPELAQPSWWKEGVPCWGPYWLG